MFLAILVVSLAVSASARLPRLDGRIVGGKPVDINDYQHQISLQYYGSHICGGSLINANTVVTAAHCTEQFNPSSMSVRCGSSRHNSGGQLIDVQSITEHPNWDSGRLNNDISVIKLAGSCSGLATVNLASSEPSGGTMATVTGWGATREGGSIPEQLQGVEVPVVDREACRESYGSQITTSMICAGVPEGGKDSCQGDSGGPMVVGSSLVGVVSWGYGCARPGSPGVYSNVAELRDFVDAQL